MFPPLPNSGESLRFLKKIHSKNSDLKYFERIQLCRNLVESKHCYATHRRNVVEICTSFWIRTKLDAKQQTQKPTKVPIHYPDKLNAILDDLRKSGIINQLGSRPHENPNYASFFLNPMIIRKKLFY